MTGMDVSHMRRQPYENHSPDGSTVLVAHGRDFDRSIMIHWCRTCDGKRHILRSKRKFSTVDSCGGRAATWGYRTVCPSATHSYFLASLLRLLSCFCHSSSYTFKGARDHITLLLKAPQNCCTQYALVPRTAVSLPLSSSFSLASTTAAATHSKAQETISRFY